MDVVSIAALLRSGAVFRGPGTRQPPVPASGAGSGCADQGGFTSRLPSHKSVVAATAMWASADLRPVENDRQRFQAWLQVWTMSPHPAAGSGRTTPGGGAEWGWGGGSPGRGGGAENLQRRKLKQQRTEAHARALLKGR